jgi:membrane-associated phospholipid phosphatase
MLSSDLAAFVKVVICGLLLLWIGGILWSRMALAAHYPTDVAGGALFGLAWVCVLWALLLQVYT